MRQGKFGRRFGRAFRRDQHGGILVTAALSMMPLTLMAFAAVEFHNFHRQRVALQDALDAAALAVARAPYTATQAELHTLYVSVLKSHLDLRPNLLTLVESSANPETGASQQPALSIANGRVNASATVAISPIVASFLINGDVKVSGSSEVRRDVSGLEVALVMDTTGSMEENNRITIAKGAARNFVATIGEAATNSTNPQNVKIGLVPFSSTVNIGPSYAGRSWMDPSALSSTHDDVFWRRLNSVATVHTQNNSGHTYPAEAAWSTRPNRWTFLANMGQTWSGCVESRPIPHDVQDTAPTTGNPDTLFVPYFHPDTADEVDANSPASPAAWYTTSIGRMNVQPHGLGNSYLEDIRRSLRSTNNPTAGQLGAPFSEFRHTGYNGSSTDQAWKISEDLRNWLSSGTTASLYPGLSARDWGVLYNATGNVGKYTSPSGTDFSGGKGPNAGCDVKPLTRLTSNHGSVITAINAMTTGGGTNIPLGLAWGYHLLSPNAPFSDGSAYNTPRVTKVAILMTDGDNAISSLTYTGIGFGFTRRLGNTTDTDAAIKAALDSRLALLCTNMKEKGIVIYTIRVEVAGDNSLLQNCATDASKAFNVQQASQLDATFRRIAQEIQTLRIAA